MTRELPEKNLPKPLSASTPIAISWSGTSSGLRVNQLCNDARVITGMLFAVALETLFTAVVAVVALAIWLEWIYLREKRKHNQLHQTDSQSPHRRRLRPH